MAQLAFGDGLVLLFVGLPAASIRLFVDYRIPKIV